MLDIKFLRENLDRVKERLAARGGSIDWERFTALDRKRREALVESERLKERKNRLSGEIGKLKKSAGDATALGHGEAARSSASSITTAPPKSPANDSSSTTSRARCSSARSQLSCSPRTRVRTVTRRCSRRS